MRAAISVDEQLPVQYVYLKLSHSASTVKSRLEALEKHRFRYRPEKEFENKRRILIGRDLFVSFTRDWLKDLSNDRINEIAKDMNDAQEECFTVFCRNLENGISSIHKTRMVALLAESAVGQQREVLVITSQNSAADSAIDKLKDSTRLSCRHWL